MAELIKPGIFINEYDKSSYITEGPTTITGVVGTSPKGAANEVTLMTSYSNFVTEFGQDSGYLDFFARFFFNYDGADWFPFFNDDSWQGYIPDFLESV